MRKAGMRVGAWYALGCALFLVATLMPAASGTTALGPVIVPVSQWAFGADHTVTASGVSADGTATYSVHASLGWHTILTQTNLTNQQFQVEANRTMVGSLFVTYCRPDCSHPIGTANISEHAWQTVIAYATFTTNGFVHTANGWAPAIAIQNSTVTALGNLTLAESLVWHSLRGTLSAHAHLDVASSAATSVAFTPALGLVPDPLGPTEWNASSTYTASGSWALAGAITKTDFSGVTVTTPISVAPNHLSAHGNVTVTGSVLGSTNLDGGWSSTAVALHIGGPFSAWEGFLLIPIGADLFGGGSTVPWGAQATGAQLASTSAVDVGARGSVAHLPILASVTSYAPRSTASGSVAVPTTALVGSATLSTDVLPPDGPAATTIQAQPESVASAQQGVQCLLVGCAGPHGSTPRPFAPLLGIGLVIVVLAAFVAVVAKRQPPRTPPASPNAALYPQAGAAVTPRAPTRVPPTEPPSEAAEDPLGHLW
ncbi:MAG: hypothetical protein L3J93_02795 [Thermoplasmata archaeon]|nr:hypothetical protein [Thermoplasmata archaeon]